MHTTGVALAALNAEPVPYIVAPTNRLALCALTWSAECTDELLLLLPAVPLAAYSAHRGMSTCLSKRTHVVRLSLCCLQINQWDDHDIFGELSTLMLTVLLHCRIHPSWNLLGEIMHTHSQCICTGLQMAGEAIQTTFCSVLSFKVAVLATLLPYLIVRQNLTIAV